MSNENKVIWSNGLFVKPHHFQQQTRYHERQLTENLKSIESNFYGFTEIVLNDELLTLGKVSLVSASGIMPDGTYFNIPLLDAEPIVLDISKENLYNKKIYLSLPLHTSNVPEVQYDELNTHDEKRYIPEEVLVRDNTDKEGELSSLQISKLKCRLMLEDEDLSAYTSLAVASVVDKTGAGEVVLDRTFYPTMLCTSSSPPLRRFLGELVDGVEQRAASISTRIGKPDQSGVAEVSDFMLLQSLNRISPQLRYYVQQSKSHPSTVYQFLVGIVGDLSTFLHESRLPPDLPAYDHFLPSNCWPILMQHLRQLLAATLTANAVPIPYERKLHGYIVAPLRERELINDSSFILAVKANVEQEKLLNEFVAQCKVSSIENIRELVHKQLPGIALHAMPVAPRQLPYHAGYSYFILDRNSSGWKDMNNSSGFAFHIAGRFPELELQFWAIKR